MKQTNHADLSQELISWMNRNGDNNKNTKTAKTELSV